MFNHLNFESLINLVTRPVSLFTLMILEASGQLIDSCQFPLQLPEVVLIKDEDSDNDDASQQGEMLILFTRNIQNIMAAP